MQDRPLILVVDDQVQNIELVEAFLATEPYDIISAVNGREALLMLKKHPVDLLLIDIMMPEMNGFEVVREVRKNPLLLQLPVIMLSALRDTEDRVTGIEAGGNDFISKPVAKTELLARIRSLLKIKNYNDLMRDDHDEMELNIATRTEELRAALLDLKSASLETIYRLSVAAEYKDEETGAHVKRMSLYSVAVARQMGMDEESLEILLSAAPMHDIGKIGIPDKVLLKPGKLNVAEWEVMKQHTVIGAKILNGSTAPFIMLGETIARSHHEKWDGSGYPDGLRGEEIPLVCRVVAIADVFDALTTKRPYKEAFPMDKSLAIIREGSGSHFDPAVTTAFFAVLDEILRIELQYRDSIDDLS